MRSTERVVDSRATVYTRQGIPFQSSHRLLREDAHFSMSKRECVAYFLMVIAEEGDGMVSGVRKNRENGHK